MIVSVLFLIGLFLCVSAYLILTGLNFIGLSYLLVYVGAVKKRIIRSIRSNIAAWVKIPLYKVLLIINDSLITKGFLIINNVLFKPIMCKNKRPSLFMFKGQAPLFFAAQSELYSSQKSCYSNLSEEFIKWFVGFSDAESNFTIVLYKDKTNKISSFTFRFIIELHVDDMDALKLSYSMNNYRLSTNTDLKKFPVYLMKV